MNHLNPIHQGKSAARQILAQMNAGVLTQAELRRLMAKVVDGFEVVMPSPPEVLHARPVPNRSNRFEVISGDRQ